MKRKKRRKREVRKGEERRGKGKGVGRRGERRRAALVHPFFAGVCCVSDTGEQMMCPTHAPSPGVPSLAGRGQQGKLTIRAHVSALGQGREEGAVRGLRRGSPAGLGVQGGDRFLERQPGG